MSIPISMILNDQEVGPRDQPAETPIESQRIHIGQPSNIARYQRAWETRNLSIRLNTSSNHSRPHTTSLRPSSSIPTEACTNWNSVFGGLYSPPAERAVPEIPYRSPSPPPPPRPYNVFDSLLNYPELLHEVVKCMEINALISLYSISKHFRNVIHKRFTATILSQSLTLAPESSRVFLFKCYKSLCTLDPFNRENEEVTGQIRFVPSFRWLRFVLHRERVVNEIMECLQKQGHRLPKRATLTIKKIWFLMDIPDNARRIGLIHNRQIWTNTDLFLATMFIIKLDMRFTHPVNGNGDTGLRKMLLGQRSLNTLARALKREALVTTLDMFKMFAAWKYMPTNIHLRQFSVLGVPPHKVGRGQYEGGGRGDRVLLRPDELVMREAIRRGMKLQMRYLDMMLWGHIDQNFQDIWPDDEWEEEMLGMEDGDPVVRKESEAVRPDEMELRDSDDGEDEPLLQEAQVGGAGGGTEVSAGAAHAGVTGGHQDG